MPSAARIPRIMAAVNGARRGKTDHPALPVTVEEIIADCIACHRAGAGAVHVHVRDDAGHHVLDPARYGAVMAGLHAATPGLLVQITTEAAGRYDPAEQMALVDLLQPRAVSVALREIAPAGAAAAAGFFARCATAGIAVQHILYDVADLAVLAALLPENASPALLFVLGSHDGARHSDPALTDSFLLHAGRHFPTFDWAVCAFGPAETACLTRALDLGGCVRVGFENNLHNADGTIAASNAARVAVIAAHAALVPAGP